MGSNARKQFPYEIERLSEEENKKVASIFNGTTWVQEMVWLINNELDYDRAKAVTLNNRFPFLEMESMAEIIHTEPNEIIKKNMEQVKETILPILFDDILTMPTTSPRFIKTHLPLSLLPPTILDNNKVVYIAREPRDVVVSYYYHNKLARFINDEPDFKSFWKLFKDSEVIWSPFFPHVQEAWEKRNNPNLLFLFYEDLLKDLRGNVQRVAEFFGKSLTSEQLNELSEHLTFDNFKKNKAVNLEGMNKIGVFTKDGAFIRQGKSGTWRDHFDPEMTLEANRWISENLQNTDLRFPNMEMKMGSNTTKHFPYEIERLSEEENKKVASIYNGGIVLRFSRIGPQKYFMPKFYEKFAERIYNLELRADDIFVAIESIAEVIEGESNDLAKKYREAVLLFNDIVTMPTTSPRFIKTHLPLSLLPPTLLDNNKDLRGNVQRVAEFFGKSLTNEQLIGLCEHLTFDNFKKNKAVNYEHMIKKGKSGSWRDHFDPEMTLEADRWISENLQNTDLRFPNMEMKMRINKKEQFPFEIERLSDEENKEVTRCYNGGVVWKFIRIGPQKYFFPNIYEKFAERIYNLELRKDDIFVASFPKCGTTWLQELVWLINNNLDYDRAKTVILNKRFPFLEMEGLKGAINTETNEIMINYTEQDKKALIPMKFDDILTMPTTSPRFIKTHLPLSLLPPTLLDNNKLMKNMNDEPDLKTFWKFFKNSQEAWEKRNHPNLLFLFYEDLLKDLRGNVQRVAEFFGKSLTNEQLNELSEHLTFDNFKKNKAVNLEEMSEKGIFTKDGAFIRQANKKEQFPYEIERLSDEENKEVTRCFNGTTWLQELVWLINNNLDYDRAKTVILNKRFPFLEIEGVVETINTESNEIIKNKMEEAKKALIPMTFDDILTMPTTSPRFIKTHLPLSLLPPTLLNNNKMVYITREPRDVVVSFYYHTKLMRIMNDEPDFKTFWKFFKNSEEAWVQRNHPNLLFLFYEDLLNDLRGNVQRVAEFFGKSLTNEQLDELCEHLTFDNFKKNKAVNLEDMIKTGVFSKDGAFIRQGKSGSWRDHFDPEMTLEADRELTGFVRVGPKGYFFPHKFKEEAESTTFSMCVHPRMKEIFTEENKDDERKLKLLEWVTQPGTEQLAAATSRRFVKTHIPLSLLPPNLLDAKVVYVARDPRDVVVSFYHLNKSMRTQGYVGDFKQFWEFFSHDLHHWTPYFEHLKEAWEMRHHPNLLFLFYEELSKDLPKAVRRVADFLGKDFNDEQIAHLCEHLSIDSFKNNKSVNYDVMKELGIMIGNRGFIRKGKAGGWRDYFDEEMTFQAERWLADNLKDTDLRFPHLQF
ncbi:unnamed protein product [Leptidea sinapis]|uniref:Sulfotransferase domain-containing protein n=1 Tax=Leptidea sinapis TaxID=189913 RepID=A0A5E4QW70_9NEOP|nr:unnamed protein product [Leptidea sinapis]